MNDSAETLGQEVEMHNRQFILTFSANQTGHTNVTKGLKLYSRTLEELSGTQIIAGINFKAAAKRKIDRIRFNWTSTTGEISTSVPIQAPIKAAGIQ